LAEILRAAIRDGDRAVIDNHKFLRCFGYPEGRRARLAEVWQHIVETTRVRDSMDPPARSALDLILARGCLARRIAAAVDRDSLRGAYTRLADCLSAGTPFEAAD